MSTKKELQDALRRLLEDLEGVEGSLAYWVCTNRCGRQVHQIELLQQQKKHIEDMLDELNYEMLEDNL